MLHGGVHELFAVGFGLAQFGFEFVANRHASFCLQWWISADVCDSPTNVLVCRRFSLTLESARFLRHDKPKVRRTCLSERKSSLGEIKREDKTLTWERGHPVRLRRRPRRSSLGQS
jgi:hypothetical protein